MNKVVRHILFVCLCSHTSIGNICILILFVYIMYRFISETYSEYYYLINSPTFVK